VSSSIGSLYEASASELLGAYRSGDATPSEAVRACLDRIDRTDEQIHATVLVLHERALDAAAESDRRWRSGEARPLEGVPYGLKDNIATAGIRTANGSNLYRDYVPDFSATVHRRLADAGAVLVAKLNTFPFTLGSGLDDAFGLPRNPWDVTRTPGGSSAGSGAALAARQLPLTIGTDGGGSIRLPASFCGVSGLKPTNGLVPTTGIMPLTWSLDAVGPMARCAEDLARCLEVVAGPDERDPNARWTPAPAIPGTGASGLRVAVGRGYFAEGCDPDVLAGVDRVANVLADLGAHVFEVEIPGAEHALSIGGTIMIAELGAVHDSHRDRMGELHPTLAEYLTASASVLARDYLHCMRVRAVLQERLLAVFDNADVLLVPTTPASAPPLDGMMMRIGEQDVPWVQIVASKMFFFSVVGAPAVSIPTGLDRHGLPIAAQLAAAPSREDLCLRAAAAFQQVTDFHQLAPDMSRPSPQRAP